MYICEHKGQTWFIDSVGLSSIYGTRTHRAKADRRAKWTNNRSTKLPRQDLKVRFALHYLNIDTARQEYLALVEERTRFADEKLFGDL